MFVRHRVAWMGWSCVAVFAVAWRLPGAEPRIPAAEAALPEGVEALPKDLQERIEELRAETEKLRGLKFKRFVPVGQLGGPALKKKVLDLFREELPPAELKRWQSALLAFGFIEPKLDLGKYLPELITSQVGGFYDPKRKYLVLVKDMGGQEEGKIAAAMGQAMLQIMKESVLVHELTHSLQDQHFGLEDLAKEKPLSDSALARLALVEGDATLAMYSYSMKAPVENLPGIEKVMLQLAENPEMLTQLAPGGLPGAEELKSAPAYLRESLLFPYLHGLVFCIKLRKAGGQPLLDYAFRSDPPRSTEHLLHPEKWLSERDDPVELSLPDLSDKLPGHRLVSDGVHGELFIRVLLQQRPGKQDRTACAAAAAGWGGDRFAVYEKDGRHATVWYIKWDTKEDAKEFAELAKKSLTFPLQLSYDADQDADGTLLIFGTSAIKDSEAIRAAVIKDTKIVRPKNQKPDLAKLGPKETAPDKSGFEALLLELLDAPEAKERLEKAGGKEQLKEQFKKLFADPEVKQQFEAIQKNLGGMELQELARIPMVRKMLVELLLGTSGRSAGVFEKGVYTNPELGVKVVAPKIKGWTLDPNPPKPPLGPAPLIEIRNGDGETIMRLVEQELPLPLELSAEVIAPMLEMGFKTQFPGYEKLASRPVKLGEVEGVEFEFTAKPAGQEMRMQMRLAILGGRMVMLMGSAPKDQWEKNREGVVESFSGFEVSKPKATPKKLKCDPPAEPEKLRPVEILQE